MIIRILFLLLAFCVGVNLIIMTCCYLSGQNLYQRYGKQMLIAFGCFVLLVVAFYFAVALIGLK